MQNPCTDAHQAQHFTCQTYSNPNGQPSLYHFVNDHPTLCVMHLQYANIMQSSPAM